MITKHQRLVAFDGALDDSRAETCVKFHQVTERKKAFTGFRDTVMVIATVGLVCSHPQWPGYDIHVRYEQIYARGQSPLNRDAESETFLKGIDFTAGQPVAGR
jgi:hypothetical protein